MKALEPTAIDVRRAKVDIAYFAEHYLEIKLNAHQTQMAETFVEGGRIPVGIRKAGVNSAAKVAIAFSRRQPQRVKVERGVIDV